MKTIIIRLSYNSDHVLARGRSHGCSKNMTRAISFDVDSISLIYSLIYSLTGLVETITIMTRFVSLCVL
jgi:hypothetical protein